MAIHYFNLPVLAMALDLNLLSLVKGRQPRWKGSLYILTRKLGARTVSGVNKFPGKGQGKIHHVVVSEEKITPLLKKKILTTERVTTSEEFGKGTEKLDDTKEGVVKIRRKDSYNF